MTVLAVGNALMDTFLTIEQNNRYTHVNEEEHTLCFTYGQKIHVEKADFLLGGNACNVGVGLSRLGVETSLFTEIGDDDFSLKIKKLLAKESIDTSHLIETPHAAASFAVGINYGHERTIFVEHVHRDHTFNFSDISGKWFYLTSLGETWEHVYKAVDEKVEKEGMLLALSPGTHQLDKPYPEVEKALKKASMLFMNKEEAMLLLEFYGNKKTDDVQTLLKDLQSFGPKVISMTDGGNGSYAIDADGKMYHSKRFEGPVVERTGAGDGYAAAFFAGTLLGKSVPEAMRWGAFNAQSVIAHAGAEPGLLTREQMEETSKNNMDFQPEEI